MDFPIYTTGLSRVQISEKVLKPIRTSLNNLDPLFAVFTWDFSKLDWNIPQIFKDIWFAILETQFKMTETDYKVWNSVRRYVKFTPVVFLGVLIILTNGIASGILMTNIFGTFVHGTLLYLAALLDDSRFEQYFDIFVNKISGHKLFLSWLELDGLILEELSYTALCSDDIIAYLYKSVAAKFTRICNYFGFTLTATKPIVDPRMDLPFLGALWNVDSEPTQTYEYMYAHICFRETYYNKDELLKRGFESVEQFKVFRSLQICLRFANGLRFVEDILSSWPPIRNWLDGDEGLLVPQFWPYESEFRLTRAEALNWQFY